MVQKSFLDTKKILVLFYLLGGGGGGQAAYGNVLHMKN